MTTNIIRSLEYVLLYIVSNKLNLRRQNLSKRKQRQVIDFKEARNTKENTIHIERARKVEIIPRNTAQETYAEQLLDTDNRITFALGPAGTGKTYMAVLRAIQCMKNHEVSRIVITRPAVSVDEQHGFLPGDINQKMEPWTRPIMDVFEEYWSPEQIADMLAERVIEICPLAYMRGRTFKGAFILADEMQNSTPEQMKMLLTRTGDGSYMAVTGDGSQHDRGYEKNGLLDFVTRLQNWEVRGIAVSEFKKCHVERDPIVETVLTIYDEED